MGSDSKQDEFYSVIRQINMVRNAQYNQSLLKSEKLIQREKEYFLPKGEHTQ